MGKYLTSSGDSGVIATRILNLGAICRWVVRSKLHPLYAQGYVLLGLR